MFFFFFSCGLLSIMLSVSLCVHLVYCVCGEFCYPCGRTPPTRSPWSNKYDPPLGDGAVPSDRLRKLEVDANHAFDTYREMYFESGICSVYLWDLDHGFAGVVLIKKGEHMHVFSDTMLLVGVRRI